MKRGKSLTFLDNIRWPIRWDRELESPLIPCTLAAKMPRLLWWFLQRRYQVFSVPMDFIAMAGRHRVAFALLKQAC